MNEDRITTIESKLAYHEDALEQLNGVITRQQAMIDNLEKACNYLSQRCNELASGPDKHADEPPPHY